MNTKKKKKKRTTTTKTTFSKIWVNRLLWVAVVDIQLPFILAFLGRENIAEKLAITIVVQIILVIIPYFCKSYFETKEEENNKLIYDYRKRCQEFNSLYEYDEQENNEEQEESMR